MRTAADGLKFLHSENEFEDNIAQTLSETIAVHSTRKSKLVDKTERVITYGVLTDIDYWYFIKLQDGVKVEFFKGPMFVGVSSLNEGVTVASGARSTISSYSFMFAIDVS